MRRAPKILDDAVVQAALALKADDPSLSYVALARRFGVSVNGIRRRILRAVGENPDDARLAAARAVTAAKRAAHINPVHDRVAVDAALARRAARPADTRDFTARFFGDPLPGESALDRKKEAGCTRCF